MKNNYINYALGCCIAAVILLTIFAANAGVNYAPGDAITEVFALHDVDGNLSNADSTPTAFLVVDGEVTTDTVTITQLTGHTGWYTASVEAQDGRTHRGERYVICVNATVDGITSGAKVYDNRLVKPDQRY